MDYLIYDSATGKYMKTWNSDSGLVTSGTSTESLAFQFTTAAERDAAITKINGNASNSTFTGSIPPPPHH